MSEDVSRFERRFSLFATLGAAIWLVFLLPTVQEAWDERGAVSGWVGLVSTVVFCGVYIYAFSGARLFRLRATPRGGVDRVQPRALVLFLVMVALAAVMVATLHANGLSAAVYVSVVGVALLPTRWALTVALVLGLGTEAAARLVPGWEGAEGIGVSVGLATFAVWGIWQALRRSRDLAAAKEENAQLMVDQERARMARDLHDILGHSLTVIAVKAELADRLIDADPARARSEIADIQRLSRDALADVRSTVGGYREVSLPAEIARARAALSAAQIEADLPGSTDEVPSQLRELFAWAVREGVTNVVRHSAATSCRVTLDPDRVCVWDDGRGSLAAAGAAASGTGGQGLTGLRERASAAGGVLVTESGPSGGFLLTVRAR